MKAFLDSKVSEFPASFDVWSRLCSAYENKNLSNGEKIDDKEINIILLISLPESYKNLIMAMKTQFELLSLEALGARLLSEEFKRKEKVTPSETALKESENNSKTYLYFLITEIFFLANKQPAPSRSKAKFFTRGGSISNIFDNDKMLYAYITISIGNTTKISIIGSSTTDENCDIFHNINETLNIRTVENVSSIQELEELRVTEVSKINN
ncbi:hypothetical protein BB560_001284 [Smittium megazygosporum]|uniref:Retrovirus-related Pol polyprotein from transposon TNT 1-94 n=1 Tax=Smittium megazygosporum TaxID=133381 RepID=A0A2T9ZI29_9FUNG|nr:hypothetical protein BB560_001284 [Smittium megazygosporum]